jgi:hypothetical protein
VELKTATINDKAMGYTEVREGNWKNRQARKGEIDMGQ